MGIDIVKAGIGSELYAGMCIVVNIQKLNILAIPGAYSRRIGFQHARYAIGIEIGKSQVLAVYQVLRLRIDAFCFHFKLEVVEFPVGNIAEDGFIA